MGRKISWAATASLKMFSVEIPYSSHSVTVTVNANTETEAYETLVYETADTRADTSWPLRLCRSVAKVELTGQSESRIISCLPELEGKISITDAPDADVLEVLKDRKRAELMAMRDAMISAGFPFGGFMFPLNSGLQADMLTQIMGMQLIPPPPTYVYEWKDAEGVYREIGTADAFQGFCAQALGYGESLFARERMLHGLIGAATTVEEVEAITWDTVPGMQE